MGQRWIVFLPFPFLLLFFSFNFPIVSLSVKMTTKFNQELYTWIKAKKNKPLSSISQWRLRVVEKEKDKEVAEKGSSTPALDEGRV